MTFTTITLETTDNEVTATIHKPASETGPGLILLPAGPGKTGPILEAVGAYLAEDGYVVMTVDPGTGGLDVIQQAVLALAPLLDEAAEIGIVGFAVGGKLALEAAAELDFAVAAVYDPMNLGDASPVLSNIRCPVIVHLSVDAEEVGGRVSALLPNADLRVHSYAGCKRGFAIQGHRYYNKWPARISYSRTLGMLRRALGPHYDLAGLLFEHLRYEFETKDADATMGTMVDAPYVNHIPTMTGGVGHDLLKRFYKYHFIPQQPDDRDNIILSETVGADTVVLEILNRFTHNKVIDHMLPGIEPTGKYVEFPVVVVAKFRGNQLYHEHIYWDQASLLKQLGVLDTGDLPVPGIEAAKKLMDETLPSNELMTNWADSEGKPI